MMEKTDKKSVGLLKNIASLRAEKLLNPDLLLKYGEVGMAAPVLVILAAGKGTRFGRDPKCIQPVHGIPLARHSIDAFRRCFGSHVICLVGYRHAEVAIALGQDNLYVRSDNPAGGTAYAAYEAFCVPELIERNPLLIITMGDRIVTPRVFRRLAETHRAGVREADITFLSAIYEPPRNAGKGRVLRDTSGRVIRIIEQRDIEAMSDSAARQKLLDSTEGNCPLYALRAATLHRYLCGLSNENAQHQFYLTDVVEAMARHGGDIRTITTTVQDPEYDLLCSDVTRPMDLALLEGVLSEKRDLLYPGISAVTEAATVIAADRPACQIASIARQVESLIEINAREKLGFIPGQPVGIGISGGRLRIAFMHPDMARFFGPAWQMPIGAGSPEGAEQIVMLAQTADDGQIHLFPADPKFRENINQIPSDVEVMYPGEEVSDLHTYEAFGTRMSETLLLSLGYFSDEELERRKDKRLPLPPPSLWVSSNMRRPFSLVGNAIASMRTLRRGNLGAKVQQFLGRDSFRGLRIACTGSIPQGGFSSSSAVTVATKNAMNALYDLGVPPDLLVHLACQAEYGTGVRAGSLDQATEQKGRAGEGTLISSSPRDNYRILGTAPVPSDRYRLIFPYSVERDRSSWRWSGGFLAEASAPGRLTAAEFRKMTGKTAEIAALLVRLPLDTDFFKLIEEDLVEDGLLSASNRLAICSLLRKLPLRASQAELRAQIGDQREWLIAQLMEAERLTAAEASQKADHAYSSLFAGWRDPVLRRTTRSGIVTEEGVPLRAMVAYLFGEAAKNFYLMRHPEQWIDCVSRSQLGDRSFQIDPSQLPERRELERELDWERHAAGPARLDAWLARCQAVPFDFNQGLDDTSLAADPPPVFHQLPGSNFFRGLALIDLAEAMLKRAFGTNAVAVRVNAAGQGDYFQVHIDQQAASVAEVKEFIRAAFYRRFGIHPEPEFVEPHSGGGAAGVRINRFDELPELVAQLRRLASGFNPSAVSIPNSQSCTG